MMPIRAPVTAIETIFISNFSCRCRSARYASIKYNSHSGVTRGRVECESCVLFTVASYTFKDFVSASFSCELSLSISCSFSQQVQRALFTSIDESSCSCGILSFVLCFSQLRKTYCGQYTNDGYNDHQLNQGEAILLFAPNLVNFESKN